MYADGVECESHREEAMAFWAHLRYPTPEGPFCPTTDFGDGAIRLVTLGITYLELAEIMGNSAARQHLHSDMMRLRHVYRYPRYMHRWQEYRDAYKAYLDMMLDFRLPANR